MAPGVDRATLDWIEKEYGIDGLLDELSTELRDGSYRPLPARRVYIPKPGTTEQRRLSIPAVRDRIVQAALKIVLEPIFEADMMPCSFGFRPRRSAHDALQVVVDETWRGRRWVVETDIADCFSAIGHDRLMQAVEERVVDQPILKLLRAMLRAGVMESGVIGHPVTGTPQGGVISPLLCNVYLHRFDRALDTRAFGVLVRYADDLLVVCKSEQQAHAALARLRELLAVLGLAPKEAKTRIVELAVDAEGFDFLGFHHRMVPPRGIHGRRGVAFLARWTSDRAMARARDRIRAPTHRSRLLLPVEVIVADLNRAGRDISVMATPQSASTTSSSTHVSGSHCSSANAINADAASGGPSWATSRGTFAGCGPRVEPSSHQGLTRPGGRNRMPTVNDVGKPCAGEPHARFDAAGAGVPTT